MEELKYILSEVGQEYNDEITYLDDDYGNPLEIYSTNEEAEIALRAKTLAYVREEEFDAGHYSYDIDGGNSLEGYTDDEALDMLDKWGLSFFRIDAVKVIS